MKRAPVIEDWSRFNRAVLDVADGNPRLAAPRPPAPQHPKGDAAEISKAGDGGDRYGLITRHKWRKHV